VLKMHEVDRFLTKGNRGHVRTGIDCAFKPERGCRLGGFPRRIEHGG
jgi:hypothetical protein